MSQCAPGQGSGIKPLCRNGKIGRSREMVSQVAEIHIGRK